MKTREELEAMSKNELDAYGNQVFRVDLDHRRKKSDLIDDLMKLQEAAQEKAAAEQEPETEPQPDEQTEQEENEAEQEAEPKAVAPQSTGEVVVTVTDYSSSSGVPLFVNGCEYQLPIGVPVSVPAFVVASLAAVADVQFTIETTGVSDQ